ncbi:MAG: AEC family transporter [Deltaproteobacteria bacterium]|nr:AEC family transporter [Deltaproteobacteria bacterium]
MSKVITTIIPIFMLIILGAGVRRLGFMKTDFMVPANRLVFYLAIPALVFRALTKASLRSEFDPWSVIMMTLAVLVIVGATVLYNRQRNVADGPLQATFAQAAIHGNLGYIGLAVAFYFLDEAGFARASMMVGFLMILQNFLGVVLLQYYGSAGTVVSRRRRDLLLPVLLNPVILAALSGIVFNLSALPLPQIFDRFLMILSGLALPMGLLLIGASISFSLLRRWLPQALQIAVLKLFLLPAAGLLLFHLAGVDRRTFAPGLILLAAPTATLTYVMAREMGGQVELAVASISLTTILSAFSYALWLGFLGTC